MKREPAEARLSASASGRRIRAQSAFTKRSVFASPARSRTFLAKICRLTGSWYGRFRHGERDHEEQSATRQKRCARAVQEPSDDERWLQRSGDRLFDADGNCGIPLAPD